LRTAAGRIGLQDAVVAALPPKHRRLMVIVDGVGGGRG
jgi:hypothetical protein